MQHKFLRQEVPTKATRREWIGLAVIAIPCLIYSMDLTVLYLAVPEIVADLKPSAAGLLWIVDIYGFMVAGARCCSSAPPHSASRRCLPPIRRQPKC
jgi:hypothetical protein